MFSNSGGGGERVLWQYIRTLQRLYPSSSGVRIVVYTGDSESKDEILAKTLDRFGLEVSGQNLEFVRLKSRRLIAAETWPRFTLAGQSIGSVLLAFEALWRVAPHVFVDTTGFAFTYPLARRVFGCSVHCYTHYPTISSDMMNVVVERRPAHNNAGAVSRSRLLARAKWVYYKAFAKAYALAGRDAHLVFVNSTWTRNHIDALWHLPPSRVHTVYPPCDTATLQKIPLGTVETWAHVLQQSAKPSSDSNAGDVDAQAAKGLLSLSASSGSGVSGPVRENLVISLAQFRPEKDHQLQIRAFASFQSKMRKLVLDREGGGVAPRVTLVLVGGVRDAGDASRVAALRALVSELDLDPESVRFEINQPSTVVQQLLARSTAALHTMWNEHFGIGVVEFMAAGSATNNNNSSSNIASSSRPSSWTLWTECSC